MVEMLVENGDVDMGIVVLPVDERKFAVQSFIEDQFYVSMNESHPYACQESIALQDLKMKHSLSLRRSSPFTTI